MAVLAARGVSKRFGGVRALLDATLVIEPGQVHALLGENGAGKSTLVKILSGVHRPDSGSVEIGGQIVPLNGPRDAAAAGVAFVSQELSLFPDLTVLDNLQLGREQTRFGVVDSRSMRELARGVLADLGIRAPVETPVSELDLGQRQLVEIARALLGEPRALILDEPTSALEAADVSRLLQVLAVLRQRRVGVVFVSHILEEVMALCDVITILRDGRVVTSAAPRAAYTVERIVHDMLGEHGSRLTGASPRPRDGEASVGQLRVRAAPTVHGERVDYTIDVGEVVGFIGVSGAGHEQALAPLVGEPAPGAQLALPGRDLAPAPGSRRAAVACGVAQVSGDRRTAVMVDAPILDNVLQVRTAALRRDGWWLRPGPLRRRAINESARVGVKYGGIEQALGTLSGGNQQKVVLAKWLACAPRVIVLDDPTRGVDVGAKHDLHTLIKDSTRECAVALMSTDLDEVLALCHRVVVFRRGRIAATLRGVELTRAALLTAMNQDDEVTQKP